MDGKAPVYFKATFQETLNLIREARDYIQYQSAIDTHKLPTRERLTVIAEHERITSRLITSMSWLITERAVKEGELAVADLLSLDIPMSRDCVLADCTSSENHALPIRLRELLVKSYSIYTRVMRLDDMVRRTNMQR